MEKIVKANLCLSVDKRLLEALRKKSLELSLKTGKEITRSMIVEKALIKFGVKPCASPKRKSSTKE